MKKRILAIVLGILLACTPFRAMADEINVDLKLDEDFEATPVIATLPNSLPAKSAILIEQQTGKVLFEQNTDEQLPPASVTKIMTLLLVMEALEGGKIHLDDMVITSEYANSMGGSQIWLKVGEQMSVDNLLKAVAISSANDASVALGEHVAGSNDAFVSMMNDRAKQLKMTNTHFLNATGLDEAGHLTTARDIALMSRELMKHPRISEYSTIWMDSLRDGATELVNTNKLVRFYKGATGLKTGTTNGAGSCLSATATRDGLSLVAVVMGCPTSDDRFSSARGLLDFGFANYESVAPPSIAHELVPMPVLRGTEPSVEVTFDDPGTFVVEKGNAAALTQQITMVEDVEAPVVEGQILGKVEVMVDGEIAGAYNLKAAMAVERMTMGKALAKLVRSILKMNRDTGIVTKETPTLPADPENPQTDASAPVESSAAEPCSCGMETCYCQEIGDVCGCTR